MLGGAKHKDKVEVVSKLGILGCSYKSETTAKAMINDQSGGNNFKIKILFILLLMSNFIYSQTSNNLNDSLNNFTYKTKIDSFNIIKELNSNNSDFKLFSLNKNNKNNFNLITKHFNNLKLIYFENGDIITKLILDSSNNIISIENYVNNTEYLYKLDFHPNNNLKEISIYNNDSLINSYYKEGYDTIFFDTLLKLNSDPDTLFEEGGFLEKFIVLPKSHSKKNINLKYNNKGILIKEN